MALQASGNPIKYSEIAGEFGYPSYKNLNNSLGAYRVSETYGTLTNLALDNTISGATITPAMPQSGTIKFSDFYSKRLNMVVDYYTASQFPFSRTTTGTYFNAYQKYGAATPANNFVNVVGGFTIRPYPDPGGKQVFIHVNGTIGSKAGSDVYVALTTGKDWNSTTRIQIDVGSSGRITGSGGNGGGGGNPGGSGLPGSSALGIEHTGTTTLVNRGYVICGYGGGGGGAYSATTTGGKSPQSYNAGGGGGGGGAGLPAGAGGSGQTGTNSNGADGGSGTLTVGGAGGGGGSNGPAAGSAGGKGGDINSAAVTASGVGGANGYAILKASTIGSFNYINTGSGVSAGSTTAVGTPQ
jgi:hypothetical protein